MKRMKNKTKRRMKGIGPLVVILIVGALAVEGVILTDLVGRMDNIFRAARETEIVRLINEMEFAKQYLNNALSFAFYQSAYELGNSGGVSSIQSFSSHNCIPFWREYGTSTVPNYDSNLQEVLSGYMNKYGTVTKGEAVVPVFDQVAIDRQSGIVSVRSTNELKVDSELAKINDVAEARQKIDDAPFLLFDVGKEISDEIGSSATSAGTYGEAVDKIKFIENKYASLYGEQGIDVSIDVENIGSSDSSYALRALVNVATKSKYPVYNSDKVTTEDAIKLSYYVVFGKETVTYSEPCI